METRKYDRFNQYLESKHLKRSQPRMIIRDVFMKMPSKHVTAEELYLEVKRKASGIGFATVYRTLKLLCKSEVCRELKFEDGTSRFESFEAEKHHDHLICVQCGSMVEIFDPEIERLQDKWFDIHKFIPVKHRLELYGVCQKCQKMKRASD